MSVLLYLLYIGAAMAKKLEGTSGWMDGSPIPFYSPSLLHLPLLLHLAFTHSFPYSSFLPPLNLANV